jgi:hypothetical protein
VDKKQIKELSDLYKTLYAMSLIAGDNQSSYSKRIESLQQAVGVVSGGKNEGMTKSEELEKLNNYIHEWLSETSSLYIKRDYADIFQKYINN